MTPSKILVVDDEPQIRRVMLNTLCRYGYEVIDARNGDEAIVKCRTDKPHLVLLDMNLPEMDGLQVCRRLRDFCSTPIIILSVRSAQHDKVQALNAGADDYVTKPFDMEELLARIHAALRRAYGPAEKPKAIALGNMKIDFEGRRVVAIDGREIRLTPKELDLLQMLLADPGQTVSHRKLLQSVWSPEFGEETGYLRVFVNHLRKKIEPNPAEPRYILTVPWVGYRFVVPEDNTLEPARTAR